MQQLTAEQILKPYQTTHDAGGRVHHLVNVEDALKAMEEYAVQFKRLPNLTAEQIQQEAERRWPFGLEERITTEIRHSAFRACATWMQEQQHSHPSPDKTAEERVKELYPIIQPESNPDGKRNLDNLNILYKNQESEKLQAAYLTGYKDALQQPAAPLPTTPQQPVRECWVEVNVNERLPSERDVIRQNLNITVPLIFESGAFSFGWYDFNNNFWINDAHLKAAPVKWLDKVTLPAPLTMQQAREIAGEAWDASHAYFRQCLINSGTKSDEHPDRDTYLNSLNLPQ